MYDGTVDAVSYRKSLVYDVDVMLGCAVVPSHCLKFVLAHKHFNPFLHKVNTPMILPQP